MPGRSARRFPPALELMLVVLVAAAVYLPFLGTRPLDFSEGHRAVPGWTMLESGDFWHIKMFDLAYFRKPPGMPWVIAAASAVLGENTIGARVPSAIAAVLMSGLAWWYGRRWFGQLWFGRSGGLAAGLAQALFPLMWSPGRTAEIEMLNNLGTQMLALGCVDLLIGAARRGPLAEETNDDEGPFGFVRGLFASARDCLIPTSGLLIAALAKGPASAPVLGGVLIGACVAARSLRPLRSPGLGIALVLGASAITLLGIKVYLANAVPDAVRENIAGQFLWSSRRVLGVGLLIPVAFISALPMSLSLLTPTSVSNDRAGVENTAARTLVWAWLASLTIFVLCGVSDARYAMPAAILLPPLAPFMLDWMRQRAASSASPGLAQRTLSIACRPAFWLGMLLMGAWWFVALTGMSPSRDQLAAPEAARILGEHLDSGDVWADDAIEARPDTLWAMQKSNSKLRVRWAKQELNAGTLPPRMSLLLLRTDSGSKETTTYAAPIADGRLNPVATAKVRTYQFTVYQVQDK